LEVVELGFKFLDLALQIVDLLSVEAFVRTVDELVWFVCIAVASADKPNTRCGSVQFW
jgi:hypothetical protein